MARSQVVSDDDIRRIARNSFVKHGPGVSVQLIADRLGVTPAAIYKRFGSKQDLFLAAFATPLACPWPHEALQNGPDGRDIEDQLAELAEAIIATIDEIGPALRLFQDSEVDVETFLAAVRVPDASGTIDQLTQWFGRCVEQRRIRPAEPRLLAAMFQGAILFHRPGLSRSAVAETSGLGGEARRIAATFRLIISHAEVAESARTRSAGARRT